MIKKYINETTRILDYLADVQKQQRQAFTRVKKYQSVLLKSKRRSSGQEYYTSYQVKGNPGSTKYKYLGTSDNVIVQSAKEVRYLKKSLSIIEKDIDILQSVANSLQDIDADFINSQLPKVYRGAKLYQTSCVKDKAATWLRKAEESKRHYGAFHTEGLIHKTDDGSLVRSKSEAIIYNLLLRLGVTFVYELPILVNDRILTPDFTLLSESDYKTLILIEHQGLMSDDGYRGRFESKVYEYLKAGYVQGVNIFYTFDKADGGKDTDPILDIVHLKIRPK